MKRYVGVLAILCTVLIGAERSVIVSTEQTVNPEVAFAEFDLVGWRHLGEGPTYLLVFDSDLSEQELAIQLEALQSVSSGEQQQATELGVLESAASLDSRIIFVLDGITDVATYLAGQAEIDSRIIFVLDGSGPEYSHLYGQYHVTETRAHLAWERSNGQQALVAVIDTGIDLDHPFLQANLVAGYDFVDDDNDPDDSRDGLDGNGNGLIDEGWGHGTHVAGIIKTIAPGAGIMPLRAVNSDGQAELSDIIAAIHYAIDAGVHIINLSMSIQEPSKALEAAVKRAHANNILVVTSAGNNDSEELGFPAQQPGVVTVAALDANRDKAWFSNFGKVTVAAPGVAIVSTHPDGGYLGRSGTSMSAPIIAGQAAVMLSLDPDKNMGRVRTIIDKTATPLDPFYQKILGGGLADVDAGGAYYQ